MFFTTPTCTTGLEHVVITPNTSLQLDLEMNLDLDHARHLFESPPTDVKEDVSTKTTRQQAIVICGFPAIGKSTFKAANGDGYQGYRVEDLDSSLFSKGPEWPNNYLDAVKGKLEERCILTISTHRAVFESLIGDGIGLVLVYPGQELKIEWLERIRKRATPTEDCYQGEIYSKVDCNWDDWIDEYRQQDGCLNYEMSRGEYLVDAIDNILVYVKEFQNTGGIIQP